MVRIPVSYQDVSDIFPFFFWYEASQVEQPQILTRVDRDLDPAILNKKCVIPKMSDLDIASSSQSRLHLLVRSISTETEFREITVPLDRHYGFSTTWEFSCTNLTHAFSAKLLALALP